MTLAAVLACRNQSSRLYAKPLQYLDVERKVSILDYLVAQLKQRSEIEAIVLAASDRTENDIYEERAVQYGVPIIRGDDTDALGRLVAGAERAGADQIFRITTESPYPYLETLPEVYAQHCRDAYDYSSIRGLPDGSYYQIVRTDALRRCWNEGGAPYRNEYCTKYIFEHQDQFRVAQYDAPSEFRRKDSIRLTVDWPEDLIVMREIYRGIGLHPAKPIDFSGIIQFLDAHPKMNAMNNWIDSGKGRVWG